MSDQQTIKYVGRSVARKEDERLLAGAGIFVGDLDLPRMLHVAFVRSPVAHAWIRAIDVSGAQAVPGVVGVYTGADISSVLKPVPGMQNVPPRPWREAVEHEINIPDQPILATRKARYVGEPVVAVVAENRYLAEDAAEKVDLDFETIPVIASIDDAVAEDAAWVHEELESNVVASFRVKKGDAAAVLASAERRLAHRFYNHRFSAMPIECRGVVGQYDQRADAVTIWSASQVVHWVRREVAVRLGLPEARVRCVAPDVGGGFGVKGHVYPEDILVPYLARLLGRPVRWLEDRSEHFLNSAHARDDRHDVEVAFDANGRIVALRDRFVKDSGAYTPVGIGAPFNTATHLLGPYDIANYEACATIVATNKTPNAPYRGAGRPEAVFVIERMLDLIARELDLEPYEVRIRNMIAPEKMPYPVGIPYRDGAPVVYDSGDFPAALRRAVEALGGLDRFRQEQRQARQEGRWVGLGLGCYVEGTGAGPFEGATVRIDPSGEIFVATGACAQGQGHETVFAQVAADEWGVTPDDVTISLSDTAAIANGYGTIASRSAVNSSSAIRLASEKLRKKVFALAGHILECSEDDLLLEGGKVSVKGVPDLSLSLRDVAAASMPGWNGRRPPGMSGGLEVTEYFEPPTVTWSYAVHAAIVEVDPGIGWPKVCQYVVVHDAGVLINPRLAEGQILGGVCQGVGGVLLEEIVYDDQGQLLTGSFMDYLLPSASEMPLTRVLHTETPSPLNSLGVKGLGEGGAIAPAVVIVNAVCDALRPFGYEAFSTPLRRMDIIRSIKAGHTPTERAAH